MRLNKEQVGILSKVLSMPLRHTLNIEDGKMFISCDNFYCTIDLGQKTEDRVTVNTEYFSLIRRSIKDDSEILIRGISLIFSTPSNTTSILLESEHKRIKKYPFDYSGISIKNLDTIFNIADKNLNLDLVFKQDYILFYQNTSIKHAQTKIYTDTQKLSDISIQIPSSTLKIIKNIFSTGCMISIDTLENCLYLHSPSKNWYCRFLISPKGRVGEITFQGSEIRMPLKTFANAIMDTKHLIKDDIQNYIKLTTKHNMLYIDANYGNSVNTSCSIPIENKVTDPFEIYWSKNMASWCLEFMHSNTPILSLKTNGKIISMIQKNKDIEIAVTTPLKVV